MSRRGLSLIEMLVVIFISTVLMGIVVTTLHTLFRAERNGRDHVSQATSVARLADQFRSDVHAALRLMAAEGEAKGRWRLAMAKDCMVTYIALPGEIQRLEQDAGKFVREESYRIPADSTVEISLRADAAPAMASLVITSPPPASPTCREIRVDAALGIDHRFAKSSEGRQ